MKKLRVILMALTLAVLMVGANVRPVYAGPGPEDADLIMGDWLVLTYLIFFGMGLLAFLVAYKHGLFRNVEDAKYYILEIDEPDYYTPEWAKEDTDGTDRRDH